MAWRSAAWLLAAACALAGCAATAPDHASPPPAGYAPYDSETNPYCGVTGTCRPLITVPYAIPGYNVGGWG